MSFGCADAFAISRALDLNFCVQCLSLMLDPKNELVILENVEKVHSHNIKVLTDLLDTSGTAIGDQCEATNERTAALQSSLSRLTAFSQQINLNSICPCCFGCLSGSAIPLQASSIVSFVESHNLHTNTMALSILIPPILDTMRLTARTVVTRNVSKTFSFPNLNDLLYRLFKAKVSDRLRIVDVKHARYELTLKACVANQLEYCSAVSGSTDFRPKKLKRKFGFGGVSVAPVEDAEMSSGGDDLSRATTDMLLMTYKAMSTSQLDEMSGRLKSYAKSPVAQPVSWDLKKRTLPIYLFGRYKKLARDVPQAPWTISVAPPQPQSEVASTATSSSSCAAFSSSVPAASVADAMPVVVEDCGVPSVSAVIPPTTSTPLLLQQRKGRCSVEEIISAAVSAVLGASDCRMHACGREDIDVRCLGNGRPFALEANNAQILPTEALLAEVVRAVNMREGLNREGDIELYHTMTESDSSLWEGMQEKAEEKRKGYACVVWTAERVTRESLAQLARLCVEDRDEDGVPCVELAQKTPLRVLHRRSLLTRKRYIYNVETALINDHYFLMRLVTSAGTYVKEFVHGDLGRTVPSVASVMGCQADILQLDVVWLYDDFAGGGEDTSEGNYIPASIHSTVVQAEDAAESENIGAVSSDSSTEGRSVRWSDMKVLKVPRYKAK